MTVRRLLAILLAVSALTLAGCHPKGHPACSAAHDSIVAIEAYGNGSVVRCKTGWTTDPTRFGITVVDRNIFYVFPDQTPSDFAGFRYLFTAWAVKAVWFYEQTASRDPGCDAAANMDTAGERAIARVFADYYGRAC